MFDLVTKDTLLYTVCIVKILFKESERVQWFLFLLFQVGFKLRV